MSTDQQPPQLSIEMKEMETSGRHIITSYGADGFRINHQLFSHGLVLTQTQIWNWSVPNWDSLSADSFAGLQDLGLEILLLGSGQRMQLLPKRIREDVRSWGITIDVMDSGAACRTYNILAAEDRAVACALFLPTL